MTAERIIYRNVPGLFLGSYPRDHCQQIDTDIESEKALTWTVQTDQCLNQLEQFLLAKTRK